MELLPQIEIFGFAQQIRQLWFRHLFIAEGAGRYSDKNVKCFLSIAVGSMSKPLAIEKRFLLHQDLMKWNVKDLANYR